MYSRAKSKAKRLKQNKHEYRCELEAKILQLKIELDALKAIEPKDDKKKKIVWDKWVNEKADEIVDCWKKIDLLDKINDL